MNFTPSLPIALPCKFRNVRYLFTDKSYVKPLHPIDWMVFLDLPLVGEDRSKSIKDLFFNKASKITVPDEAVNPLDERSSLMRFKLTLRMLQMWRTPSSCKLLSPSSKWEYDDSWVSILHKALAALTPKERFFKFNFLCFNTLGILTMNYSLNCVLKSEGMFKSLHLAWKSS